MNRQPLFPFRYPCSRQVSMPMGGLGAGCIGLNGEGGLVDFSVANRPATTALPDGHDMRGGAFALLRVINGKSVVTKLLEGPFPASKVYAHGLQAQGYRHGGFEGLPRFQRSRFSAGYPFGRVELSHPQVPLRTSVVGWSPFVPLDDIASGLPCALLEYTFTNPTRRRVDLEFSYHLSHLAVGPGGWKLTRNETIRGRGVHFSNAEPAGSEAFGSASLTVIGHRPAIKTMWLRGGWFDAVSALWREAEAGIFEPNDGREDAGCDGRNGGSVLVRASLAPGETLTIPVVIAWHFPNVGERCGGDGTAAWHPFYTSRWGDAREVAAFVHEHFASLRERTVAFQHALLRSTLPREVLDAVSANLAILKSPTILRQQNGNVWGWEGCFPEAGCCPGSCTHVWNYAQALPHLFPALERTLREQEYERSTDASGHGSFRSALPDGPAPHDFHAAADGQLGGHLKLFRDWQICGDTDWLRGLYPAARRSLEYCIRTWDPAERGLLTQAHHNTYDIEFWGADGMCGSIYVGALSAMSRLAAALGATVDQDRYATLAERGAAAMERTLFNGEYFEQKVSRRGWTTGAAGGLDQLPPGKAMQRLLRREGPKYQYGPGCLSDGVIGAWMAELYGVDVPLDTRKIRSNLRAIYRHNFRADLSDHANAQRPGYAWGKDGGLLLCSWPHGGKPTLPFVYSDEVWTGIEYQVASHLAMHGLVKESLRIVSAARARYDGDIRNPFNEYECGSYYARAMSSYALLAAYSGFRYSAVEKRLWFAPLSRPVPFRCFFSCASGFGSISLHEGDLRIAVQEGELVLHRIELAVHGRQVSLPVDLVCHPGRAERIRFTAHPAPTRPPRSKPHHVISTPPTK